MNKPGIEYKDPQAAEKAAQHFEVSAAFELRKAAIHWEETTVAAFTDGEADGWTKEAADMFFARAQHPYFVEDASKAAKKARDLAHRALHLADTPKRVSDEIHG